MQRRIIFLVNPISGTADKSRLLKEIAASTTEKKIPFEILDTNAAGDYTDLREKIISRQVTDVVIIGGDGTFSGVAGALLDLNIQFGIIPMGSGNGLARSGRIPVSTKKAIDLLFTGTPVAIDGMMINGRFSCMLCGIGFDAQVAHDFAKQSKRGLQSYVRVALRNFFGAKHYSFSIQSSAQTINTEAFFISVANSNQFGNNFTIAPQASLQDGLLDIVIVKKMSKWLLPFEVLGQVAGINALQELDDRINRKNIVYFQAAALSIENKQHAPLHIDGDPIQHADVYNITVLPKAFRLILPSA
jgi:YegS/Rv2252/BmrU family lipid kinase